MILICSIYLVKKFKTSAQKVSDWIRTICRSIIQGVYKKGFDGVYKKELNIFYVVLLSIYSYLLKKLYRSF